MLSMLDLGSTSARARLHHANFAKGRIVFNGTAVAVLADHCAIVQPILDLGRRMPDGSYEFSVLKIAGRAGLSVSEVAPALPEYARTRAR